MTKETAIDILESQKNEHYKEEINEALDMAISALKGFEGMTNGEVIQTLFPNETMFEQTEACTYYGNMRFDTSWWNAPYKEVSE